MCTYIWSKANNESVEFSEEGRVGGTKRVIMTMEVGEIQKQGRSFKRSLKSMGGKKLTGNRKECRKATNGLFLGFLTFPLSFDNFWKENGRLWGEGNGTAKT